MLSCYVLTALTFVTLLIAFFQSFLNFPIFNANHVTFMILASIIYFFTETLVIFFFVGTGVSIKEYTQEHQLDNRFRQRSLEVKRKVYPPLMLNILFMIILFVMVGAVDTYRIPGWAYYIVFAGCIFHYLRIKVIQNDCFRHNTQIIFDMSGIDKRVV